MSEPGSALELDERDQEILADLVARLEALEGPRVGDYVEFADGVTRRISHLWDDGPQTSDGGFFHLGKYGASFSGELYPIVPFDTLLLTDEVRPGRVWFWHHGYAGANNGVDAEIDFRVYECSVEAPR